MKDGFIINSQEYQFRIIEMIRKYQPEIVLCNAIDDRHPDHAKASKLVSDACLLSGLVKIKPIMKVNLNKFWSSRNKFFYYIPVENVEPGFVMDTSGF